MTLNLIRFPNSFVLTNLVKGPRKCEWPFGSGYPVWILTFEQIDKSHIEIVFDDNYRKDILDIIFYPRNYT